MPPEGGASSVRAWGLLLAGGMGAGAALLLPLPFADARSVFQDAAGLAVHVLLFGALAVLALRIWPRRWGNWTCWLGLTALAGAIELLQPVTGRSAEWADWLAGSLGAAWMCAGARRWPTSLRRGGLLLLALLPLAWQSVLTVREWQAFPVLADPETVWSRQGWTLSGVELTLTPEGFFRLSAPKPSGKEAHVRDYPGLFRRPVRRDWRAAGALTLRLQWPLPEPAVMGIRVDDRPGSPPYADRFQHEFGVTQGWNRVVIAVEDMSRTPGGRAMDLGAIDKWGVFLVSARGFDYFLLDVATLERQEVEP